VETTAKRPGLGRAGNYTDNLHRFGKSFELCHAPVLIVEIIQLARQSRYRLAG
jgi:hypothetical protein